MIKTMRSAAFVSLLAICSTFFGAGLQDPGTYAKNSHLQWNWAMQALENYSWSGRERVLDIGCGDGKISAFISEKYPNALVIGLDISPSMISFASASFPSKDFRNLIFQEGDISNLPFHEQFDLIVSFVL